MECFWQPEAERLDSDRLAFRLSALFFREHTETQVLIDRLLQRLSRNAKALLEQRLHIIVDGQCRSHIMMLSLWAS